MEDAQRVEALARAFAERYGHRPTLFVRAPGRVNLIGEHTDYNDGFVLPVAIDRSVLLAARVRSDRQVRLHALDLGRSATFALDGLARDEAEPWSNYQRGVAHFLQKAGSRLRGMDGALASNVPIGAGLSSSAAVEVAMGYALTTLSGSEVERMVLARLCQQAEHEFAGVPCGIMDQAIVALGRRDHALLLDCRTLETQHVPLPAAARIVIADTGVSRALAGSAYAVRRAECEEAARRLNVAALRDVTPEAFAARASALPDPVRQRARHVVSENARVLAAVAALQQGDLAEVGWLMNASHASLRDDYAVSGPELDAMVVAAQALPGCYGSRLTGAGFGGCTVSLVAADAADDFARDLPARYRAATGRDAAVYVCIAADGVRIVR